MSLRSEEEFALERLVVTTKARSFLDSIRSWGRSRSIWPFSFGTACCALEYSLASSAKESIGGSAFTDFSLHRVEPSSADLLIVAGTVTEKQLPILKHIYEQMPYPRWVMAVGACAASGGAYNSYHVVQGINEEIPVDVYVPGCPPTYDALIEGAAQIRDRIKRDVRASEREEYVQ